MKATSYADLDADQSSLTDNHPAVDFKSHRSGRPRGYWPAGTLFEGDLAMQLCRAGQARPADDECATALGWSEAKIKAMSIEYRMNALGINDKDARELYRAGVILGYDKDLIYIPGPNWEKYQAAKIAVATEGDDL